MSMYVLSFYKRKAPSVNYKISQQPSRITIASWAKRGERGILREAREAKGGEK